MFRKKITETNKKCLQPNGPFRIKGPNLFHDCYKGDNAECFFSCTKQNRVILIELDDYPYKQLGSKTTKRY